MIVRTTGMLAAMGGGWALMGTAGSIGILGVLAMNFAMYGEVWRQYRRSIRFRPSDGRLRSMTQLQALHTQIRSDGDEGGFMVGVGKGYTKPRRTEWFAGEDARRAISAVLPAVNGEGGNPKHVQSAVAEIESHGRLSAAVGARRRATVAGIPSQRGKKRPPGQLVLMPKPTRLALEMALHEEQERRALEGELWRLEQAWREAEEIAAIADNLVLPTGTSRFVARHRNEK